MYEAKDEIEENGVIDDLWKDSRDWEVFSARLKRLFHSQGWRSLGPRDLGIERGGQKAQRMAGLSIRHIKVDGNEIRLHLFLCLAKKPNGFGESRKSVALIYGNNRLARLSLFKKVHHNIVSFSILTILSRNSFDKW